VNGNSKSAADRQQLLHSGRQAMKDRFGLGRVIRFARASVGVVWKRRFDGTRHQ